MSYKTSYNFTQIGQQRDVIVGNASRIHLSAGNYFKRECDLTKRNVITSSSSWRFGFVRFSPHLQFVDQPLFNGILCRSVGGHAQTLRSFTQLLLLLLAVRVSSRTLPAHTTTLSSKRTAIQSKSTYGGVFCPTFAASTILAVASARSLAADRSLREFSRSVSPSASALIALTKSEVAWARIRACRTISPEHREERACAWAPFICISTSLCTSVQTILNTDY